MTSLAGRSSVTGRRAGAAAATLTSVLARIGPGGLLTGGVAATLAGLAFAAKSGVVLGPNTRAQVLLVLAGCALVAAALTLPTRGGRVHGLPALVSFGLLAVLTGASMTWSLAPDNSWLEANRTFSYFAVFAGGMALARLAPTRWDALLRGVALASVVVSGYSLGTKAFPGLLDPDELYARLREPFGYWNAVGLTAACGVPPLLWLAARRSGHAAVNALAWPGLALVLLCLLEAYSRGGLLALLAGLLVWFAAVPLRLRALVPLVVSATAAGLVTAWSFQQRALTEDLQPLTARADAGLRFGLLIALMCVVLLAVGLLVGFLTAQRPPGPVARRRAGQAVAVAVVAGCLAGVLALAAAPGGIDGQVSSAFQSLTSPDAKAPDNGPGRLTAVASVRAQYWKEALEVQGVSPWIGTGAGAYAEVRKRFRVSGLDVQDAHGYVVQTLADLGWLGLAVSLLALGTWLAAALAAAGLRRRDRGLGWDAERVGMTTFVVVVIVFGVHSLVDWTWFIPADAVLGVLCAGWVAGRGPLRARLAAEGPTGMVPAAEHAGMVPARPRLGLKEIAARWRPAPAAMGVALAVVAAGAATSWTIVQPLRSSHAGDSALARLDAGQTASAIAIARIAVRREPLATEPRYQLASALLTAGDTAGAEAALLRAVEVQPASAEAWRRLGRFRLANPKTIDSALRPFQAAYFLDPRNPESESDLIRLSRSLQYERQLVANARAQAAADRAAAKKRAAARRKRP